MNKKKLAAIFLFTSFIILIFAISLWAATNNWTFTTASNYTYDSDLIEFSGGVAQLKTKDQTDNDNTSSGFGGGTHSNTAWSSDHIELDTGQTSGTFTSRVFDAGGSTSWNSLSWTPTAPYYKELPGSATTESGYSDGNIDMTGNVLNMNMNESFAPSVDNSGNGNNGSPTGTITYGAEGKIDKALSFGGGSSNYLTIGDDDSLDIADNLTIVFWLYYEGTPEGYAGWPVRKHPNSSTSNFISYLFGISTSNVA